MPYVATPGITPLTSQDGYPDNVIDTATFIELDCETQDVNIFFTADGTRPNPFNRFPLGREQTFKYSGPFKLREGKRQLKVVAVYRSTKQPSCITSRTFHVLEAVPKPTVNTCDSDCEICYPKKSVLTLAPKSNFRKEVTRNTRCEICFPKKPVMSRALESNSPKENTCDSDCEICYPKKPVMTRAPESTSAKEVLVSSPRTWRPYPLVPYLATVEPSVNRSGFNSVSTNGSGTQINVWGPHPALSMGPDPTWSFGPRIYSDWRYGYPYPYLCDSPAFPLVTRGQLTNFSNRLSEQLLTARQKIADDVREAITGRSALKPITDRKY